MSIVDTLLISESVHVLRYACENLLLSSSLDCIPYSQLTLCAKWTYNVHYYRIYKEHRNLGIRKRVTTSCSGTKPFY